MNKTPFEKIFSALKDLHLTESEKSVMRKNIANYIHKKKTPSYVMVRRFSVLAFSFLLVISTGGILASASQGSLPGNFLYPIKRSTESVKTLTLKNPQNKVAYDLDLLEKRFNEANTLITQKKMTRESEQILAQAISQHTNDIKSQTNIIAEKNPATALVYTNELSSILKTGSSILLAISDQQPNSETLASIHTPTKLVLAAHQTADIISSETKKLETIVLADIDEATIELAEKKYQEAQQFLEKLNQEKQNSETPESTSTLQSENIDADILSLATVSQENTEKIITSESTNPIIPAATEGDVANLTLARAIPLENNSSEQNPDDVIKNLITELEIAYQEKSYGKIIIITDKIIQHISDREKIKASEKKYNIKVPEKITPTEPVKKLPQETKEIPPVETIQNNQETTLQKLDIQKELKTTP